MRYCIKQLPYLRWDDGITGGNKVYKKDFKAEALISIKQRITMASNPPSACCAKGLRHEGQSIGGLESFNGIETYVVGDRTSKKVLYIMTDAIGHKFINLQLIADQFAEAGYLVVMPDLFNGDPIALNPPAGFDPFKDWVPKHMPDITKPIVNKVYDAIVEKYSPKYITSIGYCYGAKYVVHLLGECKVQCGAVCHPSFVTIEEIKAIKAPIIICGAETDTTYTEELRHQTEAALKEIKATYFTTLASGVAHGFSVRGDMSDHAAKFAKERAFRDSLEWFNRFVPRD
jgi:dienelactone hydrolase